jgi:ABC-type multidrug transport system ATPase subunit
MALYGDFTMSETLYYFGILHGMSLRRVRERRVFLQEFLELPAQNKLIRTLR